MTKLKPCILFRESLAQEEEMKVAKKYFPTFHYRSMIPENSLVIGRYSVLPYYNELVADLQEKKSVLINTASQQRWIADLKEWYEDLRDLTPKTWFNITHLPDEGPFVLKGATNSKKFEWDKLMFARTKKEAIEVYMRLSRDSLVGQQDIYVRQYVPLRKLDEGLNGLPISEEYRFFVVDNQVVSSAFYWSSHFDDLPDDVKSSLSPNNVPKEFLDKVLKSIEGKARAIVVDIARTTDNTWIVIELNDLQMSGLSENDPEVFYSNMKKVLDI